jgi:hypothetical protein
MNIVDLSNDRTLTETVKISDALVLLSLQFKP